MRFKSGSFLTIKSPSIFFAVLILAGNLYFPEAAASPAKFSVSIPKKIGQVQETFQSTDTNRLSVIYLIQDAHSSLDAQENISHILKVLASAQKGMRIFFEGGSGEFDRSFYQFDPDPEKNKRIWKALFDEGEIGGLEYFALGTSPEIPLTGMEDVNLYFRNIDLIQKIYSQQKNLSHELVEIKQKIENLENRNLPLEIKRIFELRKLREEHQIALKSYFLEISSLAKKYLRLDFLNNGNEKGWFELARFDSLIRQGVKQDIDSAKLFREMEKLEYQLCEHLGREPETKRFIHLHFEWQLFQKLIHFSLSRDEWKSIKRFEILDSYLTNELRRLMRTAKECYETVVARDAVFLKKIEQIEDKNKSGPIAVLTGGFHTTEIASQLRKKNISYAVITPEISNPNRILNYEKRIFAGQNTAPVVVGASLGISKAKPFVERLKAQAEEARKKPAKDYVWPERFNNKPTLKALLLRAIQERKSQYDTKYSQSLHDFILGHAENLRKEIFGLQKMPVVTLKTIDDVILKKGSLLIAEGPANYSAAFSFFGGIEKYREIRDKSHYGKGERGTFLYEGVTIRLRSVIKGFEDVFNDANVRFVTSQLRILMTEEEIKELKEAAARGAKGLSLGESPDKSVRPALMILTNEISAEALIIQASHENQKPFFVVPYQNENYKQRYFSLAAKAEKMGIARQQDLTRRIFWIHIPVGANRDEFLMRWLSGKGVVLDHYANKNLDWIKRRAGLTAADQPVWIGERHSLDQILPENVSRQMLFLQVPTPDSDEREMQIRREASLLSGAEKLFHSPDSFEKEGNVSRLVDGRYVLSLEWLRSYLDDQAAEIKFKALISSMA